VPRRFPAPPVGSGTRPDAGVIVVPPAYPAPAGPVIPLPGGRPPPPPLPPGERDRLHRPGGPLVWTPGRYEVVPGIDERGRVVHEYRWIPGRFESHFDR
jgi:hypothetical protein